MNLRDDLRALLDRFTRQEQESRRLAAGYTPASVEAAYERGMAEARGRDAQDLAAIVARLDESHGWQPIETAPKDGTPILVFMRDDYMARAWQYEDGDRRKLVALASWTDHNGGGWVSYHPGKPTFWKPLDTPERSA